MPAHAFVNTLLVLIPVRDVDQDSRRAPVQTFAEKTGEQLM